MIAPPAPPEGVTLVLGGARSGKSRYAEELVERAPARTYLATAEAWDDEMRARIDAHKARRGAGWVTVEAPLALAEAIDTEARPDRAVLVDCLTLWLGNLMGAERDVDAEGRRLVAALDRARGPVVVVSNEVGLGIVPDNALARAFRDHAGRLHQAVAAVARSVVFVAAGLPLPLKPTARPELLP
ncbi:MAG: bifunctional adenosylcobinamide kinase/adenosylcobinamide-phosphate guanylyltransferase [Alphaproteobacteria bacterium]|nr:bifunctional adenosylcobinamide kinase/adenosylcobinamide-phosphate guanylyltransferase [Alphaproteobacteria bacterium]